MIAIFGWRGGGKSVWSCRLDRTHKLLGYAILLLNAERAMSQHTESILEALFDERIVDIC